jgi:hypothetical protein
MGLGRFPVTNLFYHQDPEHATIQNRGARFLVATLVASVFVRFVVATSVAPVFVKFLRQLPRLVAEFLRPSWIGLSTLFQIRRLLCHLGG